MKTVYLTDEEQAIITELKGFSQKEMVQILRQSLAEETDPNNRRTLCAFLLKLQAAKPP